MQTVKSIRTIINIQTIFVASLAVLSTWICRRYGWQADFPSTRIATAVVFPIVFSIGGAYKRREMTLDRYSSMKLPAATNS